MKKVLVVAALVFGVSVMANAQHVRVRLDFPVTIRVGAPGPPPFAGAVWIAPDWRWQRGRYVAVPGYWARPHRHRTYVGGYWRPARHGYVWVPGRWR
jgi:hypothetical protein